MASKRNADRFLEWAIELFISYIRSFLGGKGKALFQPCQTLVRETNCEHFLKVIRKSLYHRNRSPSVSFVDGLCALLMMLLIQLGFSESHEGERRKRKGEEGGGDPISQSKFGQNPSPSGKFS